MPQTPAEAGCVGRLVLGSGRLLVSNVDMWQPSDRNHCSPAAESPGLRAGEVVGDLDEVVVAVFVVLEAERVEGEAHHHARVRRDPPVKQVCFKTSGLWPRWLRHWIQISSLSDHFLERHIHVPIHSSLESTNTK